MCSYIIFTRHHIKSHKHHPKNHHTKTFYDSIQVFILSLIKKLKLKNHQSSSLNYNLVNKRQNLFSKVLVTTDMQENFCTQYNTITMATEKTKITQNVSIESEGNF